MKDSKRGLDSRRLHCIALYLSTSLVLAFEQWREVARRQLGEPGSTSDRYPSTTEVLHHIAEHGFSHDDELLFGLDLILGGLEQRLPGTQKV